MKIIEKFGDKIKGILSAFDRMIIKGHLRQFYSTSGKMYFLSQEGIKYERYDNSFIHIEDIAKAQEISDAFTGRDISNMLNRFAKEVNPFLTRLEEIFHCGYFWCLDQCEYATDVMFQSRQVLESVYTDLVQHALLSFKCEDVMTFLGRKMHHAFSGEVVSDIKKRSQGVRIKHRMKSNSIKMYDKYSILRVETTINDPREFKIYKESGAEKKKKWVPMGKSIANLYRYAQVSEAANRRYLDAISLAEPKIESIMEIENICNRVNSGKRTFSGMNPVSKAVEQIFLAVMNGANHINGFTNASLRKELFPDATPDDKKVMNKTTRIIAKLRAHKLIAKIPHSFRYKVTPKGIRIMSAALAVKNLWMTDAMKKAS